MKQMHLLLALALLAASLALAQAPAATPPGTPAPSITADDLKNVETPKAEVRVNGDPDGSMTGTAADISIADPKKGSPFQTS